MHDGDWTASRCTGSAGTMLILIGVPWIETTCVCETPMQRSQYKKFGKIGNDLSQGIHVPYMKNLLLDKSINKTNDKVEN